MSIPRILQDIAKLLQVHGYETQANWLGKKAYELQTAENEKRTKDLLTEIKGIIAGMGSLSDIYLIPSEDSKLTKMDANQKLGQLIDELDRSVCEALSDNS